MNASVTVHSKPYLNLIFYELMLVGLLTRKPRLIMATSTPTINKETAQFLARASQSSLSIADLLNDPRATAKKANLSITKGVVQRLEALRDIQDKSDKPVDPAVTAEIVNYYNRVITDGRYIKEWLANPANVSNKLGIKLSDSAQTVLIDIDPKRFVGRGLVGAGGETVMSPIAVAVVVVIVIVLWTRERLDLEEVIIDKSGTFKI